MRKPGRKNNVYSAEFKICVIMDMREHNLSYNETVKKYELGNPQYEAARAMLQRWERIHLEEGAEGLRKGKPLEMEVRPLPLYSSSLGNEMSHAYGWLP